jgi:hypothetical protein
MKKVFLNILSLSLTHSPAPSFFFTNTHTHNEETFNSIENLYVKESVREEISTKVCCEKNKIECGSKSTFRLLARSLSKSLSDIKKKKTKN